LKPWLSFEGLPKFGEVLTLVRVHPCHSGLPSTSPPELSWRYAGFIKPAATRPRRPPSVQSRFAQLGCYLRWGDVIRLLRGHYSSVVARTGSCAAPVGLSPPSAFGLVWRVLAGCNQSLLPTAASRRYLQQSVLGCWIPYPGGTPCALTCYFHDVIGLPQVKNWVGFPHLSCDLRLLAG
jgi:hypothetical protein